MMDETQSFTMFEKKEPAIVPAICRLQTHPFPMVNVNSEMMKPLRFPPIVLAVLAIVALLAWPSVAAPVGETMGRHPVPIIQANIYVSRYQATMKLTCYAEDLELLQGVEPLENGFYDSDELLEATRDHADYLAEKITLRDIRGEPAGGSGHGDR